MRPITPPHPKNGPKAALFEAPRPPQLALGRNPWDRAPVKFDELGLCAPILSAVKAAGYTEPTPIQRDAIPPALKGRDVLGCAQTGTGKTAAFSLPLLQRVDSIADDDPKVRALVVTPTRELAAQIGESIAAYGKGLKDLWHIVIFGGVNEKPQIKELKKGVDVIVATPGRLLDLMNRGFISLADIDVFVLDEADRMLDMGFIEDLERIFKLTPFTRQTLFFSATMPPEITRLTQEFLSNPERIEVARASSTVETIEQRLVTVPGARGPKADALKRSALRKILEQEKATLTNGIIFCNRKRDVSVLFKSLTKYGYNCGALHGDLDQRVRMQVLDGFRNNQISLLVASDVAARGLDIPSVSHVFNFDVPINAEDYVHRIGRTGRAGRQGVAYTLTAPSDSKLLAKVEELIGKPIPPVEVEGLTEALEQVEASEEKRSSRSRGSDDEKGGERRRGRRRERASDEETEPQAEASPEAEVGPQEETSVAAERSEQAEGETRSRRRRKPRERSKEGEAQASDAAPEDSARVEAAARNAETPRSADSSRNGDDKPKPRRGGRARRDEERNDRGRDRNDRGKPVVGLGDHVPAFLMREVPMPTRAKATAEAEISPEQAADQTDDVTSTGSKDLDAA